MYSKQGFWAVDFLYQNISNKRKPAKLIIIMMLVTTALAAVGQRTCCACGQPPRGRGPWRPGEQLIGPQRWHRRPWTEWPVARKEAWPSPGTASPRGILTAIALLHGSKTLLRLAPMVHWLSGPHPAMSPLTSPPAVRHALPPPTNLGWLLAHLWAPGKGQAWQLCLCPTGHGHRPGWRRLPSVQTPTCLDVEAPRTSVGSSSHELIKYNHLLFLSCKILQGLTWIFSPKWEFWSSRLLWHLGYKVLMTLLPKPGEPSESLSELF